MTSSPLDTYQPLAQSFAMNLLQFMEALRKVGFKIDVNESRDALALASSDVIANRSALQLSLKTLLCSNQTEWNRFDHYFSAYFSALNNNNSDSKGANDGWQHKNHSDMDFHIVADFYQGFDEGGEAGAGRNGTVTNTDFRFITDPEGWEEAAKITENLAKNIKVRPSRRWHKSKSGKRIDLAATNRHLLASDGDPLRLHKKSRKFRPVHIVALLDVSHSMSYYCPMLARFVRGLLFNFDQSEAFCFHTELNHITEILKETDMAEMRRKMENFQNLWSGGTNIAASLTSFNKHHLDEATNRSTTILLISDGCDTTIDDEIIQPIREMKARVRKIIWIDPMFARLEKVGMQSSSPLMQASTYIDEIVSGDSLQSLEKLTRLFN